MALIGWLNIFSSVDDKGVKKGTKGIASSLLTLKSSVASVQGAFLGLGAILTTGIIASGVKSAIDAVDELGDTAGSIGIASTALAQLQYAALKTGSDAETLNGALLKLQNNLATAALQGGPIAKSLEQLGLSAKDLIALSPDQQFKAISEALSKVENPAVAASLAIDLMGKSAQGLLPLLMGGSDAIDSFAKRYQQLTGMSEFDITSLGDAKSALEDLDVAVQGLWVRLASALTPAIIAVTEALSGYITSSQSASGQTANMAGSAATAAGTIGVLGDSLVAMKVIWDGVVWVFKAGALAIIGTLAMIAIGIQELVNLLPGVDAKFADSFIEWGRQAKKSLGETSDAIASAFNSTEMLPSEKINKRLQEMANGYNNVGTAATNAANNVKLALTEQEKAATDFVEKLAKTAKDLELDVFAQANDMSKAEAEFAMTKDTLSPEQQAEGKAALQKIKDLESQKQLLEEIKQINDDMDEAEAKLKEDTEKKNLEDIKRSEDEMGKQIEEMKRAADDIRKASRSPLEQFQDDIQHIKDIMDAGFLDSDEAQKAFQKIADDQFKEQEHDIADSRPPARELAGALDFRSNEGRSLLLGTSVNPIDKLEKKSEEQIRLQQDMKSSLRTIAKKEGFLLNINDSL